MDYKYQEIYFVNSIKFRLHYHHAAEYKSMVKAVDNFIKDRKHGQNTEVVFLPGGEEIRIIQTSDHCFSVYYKRKRDLE